MIFAHYRDPCLGWEQETGSKNQVYIGIRTSQFQVFSRFRKFNTVGFSVKFMISMTGGVHVTGFMNQRRGKNICNPVIPSIVLNMEVIYGC